MREPSVDLSAQRKIAILPDHLANKIAAGEVIQRPDSVVKELLENSLDAGATRVVISVRDGGTSFIQVADNGLGLDADDASMAFVRHATSKIATYDDLESIRTYGFRGEALASIGAVAQVAMKTRRPSDEAATLAKIDGGGRLTISREAREPGTTVTVQNLFFNVPARKKFLKSGATEFRHVHETVQRAALSRPDVEFRFLNDENVVLHVRPSAPNERVGELFGDRVLESLISVEESTDLMSIWGFIGKPTFGQKTRSGQYLFLNHRFIVHRNIGHAIFSGYEHLLLKGTFPFYVLFIDVDPARADVNVHPSKMEAKFDDEHAVYRMTGALVRRALANAQAVPGLSIGPDDPAMDTGLQFTGRQHSRTQLEPLWEQFLDRSTGEIRLGTPPQTPEPTTHVQMPHESDRPAPGAQGLIWQLHNKYILCQVKSGLMIIDQHVAHERVLYELALDRYSHGTQVSQQLLFPITVQLTAAEYSLMEELMPHFRLLGFDLNLFGRNTVVLEGLPPDVRQGNEESIIQGILSLYREYSLKGGIDSRDMLAKSYSCRSAIKAGDALTDQEMRALVDQLFATTMPYVCPHGRPVVLRIPLEELDRRFGRL